MSELHPEVEIRDDQAEAIARGLFAVARADGQVHEREAALIAEFFASATDHAATLGALERAPSIDGASLAQLLPSPELRELFIKTAYLVAYTDSVLGDGESQIIGEYATALGISSSQLQTFETQVKEYLLSHLSHLANVDAAAEVARRLKV
jgi:uncharacterized tellurite resistance protein B-like protein